MSSTALYTNLSGYYDLMCADINYQEQSDYVHRIHQLLGSSHHNHLDLACGTGPHVRHFIDFGYRSSGLDINQPMLDIAQTRCPEAHFVRQDMSQFTVTEPLDLITCFLYSIHYNSSIAKLMECITRTYVALKPGGIFCFNTVDKNTINNRKGIKHSIEYQDQLFTFQSNWNYCGTGEYQSLQVQIEKITKTHTEIWNDEHPMVAVSFQELQTFLAPYFEVHIFEHDYGKIVPWGGTSGNAIFVGTKI